MLHTYFINKLNTSVKDIVTYMYTEFKQCRTVYGTERICHTCDIFGPNMSHVWYIRSNTAHPPAGYGTKMCHIRLHLVFLCSPKRICHLPQMRIKTEKSRYMSHVYLYLDFFFYKKSSSCTHWRPKTLIFIITLIFI